MSRGIFSQVSRGLKSLLQQPEQSVPPANNAVAASASGPAVEENQFDDTDPNSYRSDQEKERKLQSYEYEPEGKPKEKVVEERLYGGEANGHPPPDLVVEGGGKQIDVEEEALELPHEPERPPNDREETQAGKPFLEPSDKQSPAPRKRTIASAVFDFTRSWSTRSVRSDFDESVDFVERPSDEYQCPICFKVVREPFLTNCCGARFCKRCIVGWKEKEDACPMCREEFRCMPDKRLLREIREMKVHCLRRSSGCQWIGTYNSLRHHLKTECEHEIVPCSKGCDASMPRKQLLDHLQNACSLRMVVCEFCQFEGTYSVVQVHKRRCGLVPESCPNVCGAEPLERHYMDQHLSVCPLQTVACDFSHVGCTTRVQRKDLRQHIQEDIAHHVKQMAAKLRELRQVNTSLHMALEDQHRKEHELKAYAGSIRRSVPVVPFDFTYDQYSRRDAVGGIWMGPAFYTHYKGYKLGPKIYPHGHDHGKAHFNYISLFFSTLRGEFDDELHWPVRLQMTVEILNPRYPEGEPWQPSPPVETIQIGRTTVGHLKGQQGWKIFIKPSDAQRYLKEDCLHFRITNIEIHEVEA